MKRILNFLLLWFCYSAVANADLETSGDVIHILLPATAFGTSLLLEDDYEGSWQLIKTGFTSRLAVEGLKAAVTKKRPDNSGDDSLPSGHAADTFAASSFIQQRYGWQWAIPAYLGASYVAYTRVESDKHDTQDVLLGAAIGVLSGLYFTEAYQGTSVKPWLTKSGQVGVVISSSF